VFQTLLQPARYKGAHGGRGSWNDKGAGVNVQTLGATVVNVSYRREPLQIGEKNIRTT
jgi:hypothetical protein